MRLPSPGFLLDAFLQVCRRFPGTMIAAFTAMTAMFTLVQSGSDRDLWVRAWLSSQLGLALLTGIVLLAESRQWSKMLNWGLQIAGIGALVGYFFWLEGREQTQPELIRYLSMLIMAHLFVSAAPYFRQGSVSDFWHYNKTIFANFILGAAFSIILFAGLSLAMLAVNELFDLHLSDRPYGRLFAFIAFIFNSSYFLYHCPKDFSFGDEEGGYVIIFKHLCKFILIPIVLLYFIILYVYAGKVLLTWSLPHGWISSLVIGFSIAGIFTYLLNFFLPDYDENALVHAYKRWFWWVVSPMCVLLFVAIGYRIRQYGITEERYLVAHTGFWLSLNCLYFLISKRDNIKFIPFSLFMFILVYAFGPFSAASVSVRNQISRLTHVLEQNGRLQNGKMVKGTSKLLVTESNTAIGALDFLADRNALNHLSDMLPMPLDSFSVNNYEQAGAIAKWLNIETAGTEYAQTQRSFNCPDCPRNWIDVKGFSQYQPLNLSGGEFRDKEAKGDQFYLSEDRTKLEWVHDAQVIATYDLKTCLQRIKGSGTEDPIVLQPDQKHFDLSPMESKQKNIRLIVWDGSIDIEKENGGFNYLNGAVLVR